MDHYYIDCRVDSRGDEITDGLSNTDREGAVSVSYLPACSQRKVR